MRRDLEWILGAQHILESPIYGVLNVGRILWVLEEVSSRLVPSKEEAGVSLRREVPVAHRKVVELALDAYRDPSPISAEDRRMGGRAWPEKALLSFRDWARERSNGSSSGTS